MKFLLGKKQSITQIFDESGNAVAGTMVSTSPLTVVGLKTEAKDGYNSVLVGFGDKKSARAGKARVGIAKKAGKEEGAFEYLKEFRISDPKQMEGLEVGSKIGIDTLSEGSEVIVTGTSKGKGFQGVVKRHGFSGGPRSHGQRHSEREPGSIGSTGIQRVLKGMRMAGRMGGERVTVKNLKVLKIDVENNVMFISGSVPGVSGSLLEIRTTE